MASNSKKEHAKKKEAMLAKKQGLTAVENGPGLTRAADQVESTETFATVTDLPRVIAESKAQLEAEGPIPLKRGRGRPPKVEKQTAAAPEPAPQETSSAAAATSESDVSLVPMISDGIQMFYSQRAQETGWKGFEVRPEKADMLASQIEQCANHYFPQLSEKASLLAVTIISCGMHVLGTEMGYRRWRLAKEIKEAPTPEKVEKKIEEEKSMASVGATSYFPRTNQ